MAILDKVRVLLIIWQKTCFVLEKGLDWSIRWTNTLKKCFPTKVPGFCQIFKSMSLVTNFNINQTSPLTNNNSMFLWIILTMCKKLSNFKFVNRIIGLFEKNMKISEEFSRHFKSNQG